MGCFDDVIYEMPCPICGEPITGFQTKDAGQGMQTITPAKLWKNFKALEEIYGPREGRGTMHGPPAVFYSNCENCATWIDVTIRPGHKGYGENQIRGPILPEES